MTENKTKYSLIDFPLFEGVSDEIVKEIENRCEWRTLKEGELVFDEHTDNIEVYLVVKGKVRVLADYQISGEDRDDMEEKEVAFAEIKEGDYFGEISVIDGRPRTAQIKTITETFLAVLSREQFSYLIENVPQISFRVVKKFARIIRRLDRRVAELSTLSESERICSELARLSVPDISKPNGRIIHIMPRHQDIAMWASATKEMVAQTIGELARNKIVERKSLSLAINDWEKLLLLCKKSV
jgi:CRP-like cAMP-binding protein